MGPNELVPTLLIFGVYLKMTKRDVLFPSITQLVKAIKKVIDDIKKNIAFCQVNSALNTYNKPSTGLVHDLPINFFVLVY